MRLNIILTVLMLAAFCGDMSAVKSPSYFTYTKRDVYQEMLNSATWSIEQAHYNHEQRALELQKKWVALLEACQNHQSDCVKKNFDALIVEIVAHEKEYLSLLEVQGTVIDAAKKELNS